MSGTLREQFLRQGRVEDCPVYDLHGHWGPHYAIHLPAAQTAEARRLLRLANVQRLVVCHHFALFSPDFGNRTNINAVRGMPDVLRAYCAVNGNYPDEIEKDLLEFDRLHPDIFVGFKLLADYHQVPVGDSRLAPVWEKADRDRLLVLLHTWGGSRFDGYEQVQTVAERYPGARILMGHSLHGDWDRAIELATRFENLHLELTAVPDERGVVERFVAEAGSSKVVFGTDFPWFSHHYYIGTLLGAGLDDEQLKDVLYRNARRLLGEAD